MATPSVHAITNALIQPHKIRSVCVIAHVDHGKTSLCDHLIASNGYLSKRSAGSARFMDAREDEQNRMITIKSSAIPLVHQTRNDTYLVNLVDSPGHIDFSVEVSAAARLCDGGLLVVDVLEGFQSQSRMVMRQAWKEGLTLILVLSKMDRLVTEARLSPTEIYRHLRGLLENINAYLHQCVSDSLATDDLDEIDEIVQAKTFSPERGNVIFASAIHGWAFTMAHFAESLAHRIAESRKTTEAPVDIEALALRLRKAFWGDFYLDIKSGQVVSGKKIKDRAANKMNIACQYVFQPLVEIYSIADKSPDATMVKRVLTRLRVSESELSDRAVEFMVQRQSALPGLMMAVWTPCARNCLDCIVEQIPSPIEALPRRIAQFGGSNTLRTVEDHRVVYIAKSMSADVGCLRLTGDKLHGRENLTDFVGFGRVFSGDLRKGDELIVCDHSLEEGGEASEMATPTMRSKRIKVQKLFVPAGMDLLTVDHVGTGAIVAIGFALPGQEDHSTDEGEEGSNSKSLFERSVQSTADWLLHLKAQKKTVGFEDPESVELEGFNPVDRCVTLSDSPEVKPFDSVYRRHTAGMLRFGVSPESLADWPTFMRGLALLYRADPAVHIDILESGEFILCCQGQVHAERAVQDLNQLYCPEVKLKVTPPLIAIRETIVTPPIGLRLSTATLALPFPPWAATTAPATNAVSSPSGVSPTAASAEEFFGVGRSGNMLVKVIARPMDPAAIKWMDVTVEALFAAFHDHRVITSCFQWFQPNSEAPGGSEPISGGDLGKLTINDVQEAAKAKLYPLLEPSLKGYEKRSRFAQICVGADSRTALFVDQNVELSSQAAMTALVSGFQSASRLGPYCEEPVRGVIFIVTTVSTTTSQGLRELITAPAELSPSLGAKMTSTQDPAEEDDALIDTRSHCSSSQYTTANLGVLIGCTRLACRSAMEIRGAPRVFELMLNLELVCDEASLGKIHGLLAQKRAQVTQEDMDERTLEFRLIAKMPSTETWDLAAEIRRRSSGKASVSFSVEGWELNLQDPFPEAVITEEEEEEEGTNIGVTAAQIVPRSLVMAVRKRKGLATGEKVVAEGADKQRTLGRSK